MGLSLFATVPRGLESLLAGELRTLGAVGIRQLRSGVSFSGSLETAYRVCLWSRMAGRVLLTLTAGPAADADELYETVRQVDWGDHLAVGGTLAVDFTGTSASLRDTRFGAVRVKDAIVDQFRERHGGSRPSVDARAPDVRVNAHLARAHVTVSIDLSGDSLHRRGYRTEGVQVEAPLKETLAAAILRFAVWPREAAAGASFLDPLCGSGTLPIEAAWMAADVAPGLLRAEAADPSLAESQGTLIAQPLVTDGPLSRGFGLTRWMGHDAAVWTVLVAEAQARRRVGLDGLKAAASGAVIRGSDRDTRAVRVAQACVKRAGLSGIVVIDQADLADIRPPTASGLVAANTPYGERLGDRAGAEAICRLLGERLRIAFRGWRAAVLTGDPRLAAAVGLPAARDKVLRNGALDCTLSYVDLEADATPTGRGARAAARSSAGGRRGQDTGPAPDGLAVVRAAGSGSSAATAPSASGSDLPLTQAEVPATGAQQLANRLRRDLRHIGRTMRRQGVTCYRLYDADLPQYSLAVDVYEHRLHVQEYAPPAEIDPIRAAAHLDEAVAVIADVLKIARGDIVVKQRRRQRGAAQYERRAGGGVLQRVTEDELAYLVDLERYLDTGLFLDQRETRRLIRKLAGGRRFLNLFAYTGAATVCAIAGGSPTTTTVDLSATYLDWARRNLAENGVTDATLERAPSGGPSHGDESASTRSGRAAGVAHGIASGAPAHRLVQADCLTWLAEAEGEYDLILLDPPTFSNSKRMGRATFDVQRDHPDLIRLTARRLLAPGGILLFACNRRGFKLDPATLPGMEARDLSRATLAQDFARRANAHHVWRLEAHGTERSGTARSPDRTALNETGASRAEPNETGGSHVKRT